LAKIDITPEIESVINTTIEKECKAMGHTDDSAKIIQNQLQTANSQLQQQLQIQNQQIEDLQNTNTNLNQKLSSIKSTVEKQ
jgi:cell division protein FtsB